MTAGKLLSVLHFSHVISKRKQSNCISRRQFLRAPQSAEYRESKPLTKVFENGFHHQCTLGIATSALWPTIPVAELSYSSLWCIQHTMKKTHKKYKGIAEFLCCSQLRREYRQPHSLECLPQCPRLFHLFCVGYEWSFSCVYFSISWMVSSEGDIQRHHLPCVFVFFFDLSSHLPCCLLRDLVESHPRKRR